jgi:hypothetical protein
VSRGYLQITEGDWIQPVKKGFKHQCCDCAMVHTTDYRIVEGSVQFRVKVDRRATAAARRPYKFSKD